MKTGLKRSGGRPRKFAEASKAVTVTLPERILELLGTIHQDRARAITKATEYALNQDTLGPKRVRLVEIEPGVAVIVVGPSRTLQKIHWLKLVEIAPARYVLAIPSGTPTETLEVAILDLIEELQANEETERDMLEELHRLFNRLRRQKKMTKSEIIFVDTGSTA